MNRRRFFRAAASFVAGCAIGLGLRQQPVTVIRSPEFELAPEYHSVHELTFMVLYDRDNPNRYQSEDGVRQLTYKCIDGKWTKHESTRKA